MKTLGLLRHAKSDWGDPTLDDKVRPLNARGRKAAPRIGEWLAARKPGFNVAMVSTALRTQQTWALVGPCFDAPVRMIARDDLYLATDQHLLAVVRGLAVDDRAALLVGHNSGLEDLASSLVGSGDQALRAVMAVKFPTAAVAILEFDVASWSDIAPGCGRLTAFMTPKRLDGAGDGRHAV